MRPPTRKRRGYSLIEALLAGVVFATGFAGILSATASYMNVVEHDRKLGEAWRLLQGQAAMMRGLPDTAPEWLTDSNVTVDRFGNSGTDFTVNRTVRLDTPFPTARQVELRATWLERAGSRSTILVIHR